MKDNSIQQYIALRDSLLNEKTVLEARLVQINRALSGEVSAPETPKTKGKGRVKAPRVAKVAKAPKVAKVAKAKKKSATRGGARVIRNKVNLQTAVAQVTKGKAMTKEEILAGLDTIGYKFTAKNPINSLNTVLYAKNKFKRANGKFSPIGS
jgi:hypothetical protein